jgi:hypothetical protein
MTPRILKILFAGALAAHAAGYPARAGHMVAPPPDKSKIVAPEEDTLPPGMLTLGGKFSEDLQSGFVDSITPSRASVILRFSSTRGARSTTTPST